MANLPYLEHEGYDWHVDWLIGEINLWYKLIKLSEELTLQCSADMNNITIIYFMKIS